MPGEGSSNPCSAAAALEVWRPCRVSTQCQVGCSCLEKELLGWMGRKDFFWGH